MIRAVLMFLALWGAVAVTIQQVRHMSGKELLSAAKCLTFSLICAIMAFLIMSVIVILF